MHISYLTGKHKYTVVYSPVITNPGLNLTSTAVVHVYSTMFISKFHTLDADKISGKRFQC